MDPVTQDLITCDRPVKSSHPVKQSGLIDSSLAEECGNCQRGFMYKNWYPL